MKVLLLGAGASRAYTDSKSGLLMPLARDFLKTFGKSVLAQDPWVLTGSILTYARDVRGIPVDELFRSDLDIEAFHSEVESKFLEALRHVRGDGGGRVEAGLLHSTYVQLLFIFAATINLIQNGPSSLAHKNLARLLTPEDVVITFNWDTLMDRALWETTAWQTDSGYGFTPHLVYRNEWQRPKLPNDIGAPVVLKLHGSSNWITSYLSIDFEKQAMSLMQAGPTSRVYVYEGTLDPYPTYDGRYMSGYEKFSYGYYPPNLPDDPGESAPEGQVFFRMKYRFPWMPVGTAPDDGLVSSPLIIPPVHNKAYDLFGNLFDQLWQHAESALRNAGEIAVVGYSFPVTDHHSINLFKRAFARRTTIPRVTIVNPHPERTIDVLSRDCGIPKSHLRILSGADGYFAPNFECSQLWQRAE